MMHANANRNSEAFQALVVAQSIDPNFDVIYLYRGQLFERLNNLTAAEPEFRHALAINPRNEQANPRGEFGIAR